MDKEGKAALKLGATGELKVPKGDHPIPGI